MRKVSTALVAAGLLSLGACGGGSEQSGSANGADEVNVASDDLTATDNLGADTLGNDANALGLDAGNAVNAVDANLSGGGNATDAAGGDATGNATDNSQ